MQRLFERLTHAQERRERLAQGRSAVYHREDPPHVASIKAHLARLLNTRRGSVRVDEHYGIPVLAVSPNNNSLADREAMGVLIRGIIERYETRLIEVTVDIAANRGDEIALGCEIRARVRPGLLPTGTDSRVELRAELMTDGTIVFE